MNTPQSGILPTASSSAYFLCLNIKNITVAKQLLLSLHEKTAQLSIQYPEAHLTSVAGVGLELWENVFKARAPVGLKDFQYISNLFTQAPATQFDVILHIRSERHDINFELAKIITGEYSEGLSTEEEVHGFRYLDSRDLSGFVDGTENPQTLEDRTRAALTDNSGSLSQGSFIHIQRYIHKLPEWQTLPVQQQEDIIGRSKVDNIEYQPDKKPLTSHIKRAGIKHEDGSAIEILRHSMPYGNTQEHGLFFISYASDAESFPLMLNSMIQGDGHGNQDHLLKYTTAITGAAFYAPPLEFLLNTDNYR
jgi:putative iron-dependent peroxidase